MWGEKVDKNEIRKGKGRGIIEWNLSYRNKLSLQLDREVRFVQAIDGFGRTWYRWEDSRRKWRC